MSTPMCGAHLQGANILVDKAGTVKLADFGASKKIEDLATMGGSKSIKGTPYWMVSMDPVPDPPWI